MLQYPSIDTIGKAAIELFQDECAAPLLAAIKNLDSKLLSDAGRMVAFAEYYGAGVLRGPTAPGILCV